MRNAARCAAWASACLVAFSCARVAAPPGGPEDRDPPRVQSTSPAPDSSGVSPKTGAWIVFSEGMDRRNVSKRLRVIPQQDVHSEWAEDTLHVSPEGEWPRDRSTIIWVGDAARDSRGNPLEKPLILRFTTRVDSVTGTITGRVFPGKEARSPGRLLVAPFPAATFDSTSAVEGDPEAIVEAAADGTYRIAKLPPGAYRVLGIFDRDADARAGASGEAWGAAPEPVTIGGEQWEANAGDFLVGTLDSLGTIHADILADSGRVVMEASEDSTTFLPLSARAMREGSGPISVQVPTGRDYFVRGFADANGDTLLAPDEMHIVHPERISFRFTNEKSGIRFDLRSAKEEP